MDEYISKEKVVETIQYRVCQGHGNKEHICERGSCAYCGIMEIMSDISSIEATDVQPVRHGKWEIKLGFLGEKYSECSYCRYDISDNDVPKHILKYDYKYCPNCGAKMDGGDSE